MPAPPPKSKLERVFSHWGMKFALPGVLLILAVSLSLLPYYREYRAVQEIERLGGSVERHAPGSIPDWLPPAQELPFGWDELYDPAVIHRVVSSQTKSWTQVGLPNLSADEIDAALKVVGDLRNVRILSTGVCPITNEGYRGISKLKDLEALTLYYYYEGSSLGAMGRTEEDLDSIGDLSNLKYLRVIRRRVSEKGHAEIGKLRKLEFLELWHEAASDAGLARLVGLKKLETLSLSNHRLTDAGLENVGELSNLRILNLDVWLPTTEFSRQGLRHLGRLERLEWLNLSRHAISDEGMESVSKLKNLKNLYLTEAQITDHGLKHLPDLKNLENLTVDRTKIGDAALEHISQISNLRSLNLSRTNITNDGLRNLSRLTRLESLILDNTKINEHGLHHLWPMTQLKTLKLHGTSILNESFEELKRRLPNCQIN